MPAARPGACASSTARPGSGSLGRLRLVGAGRLARRHGRAGGQAARTVGLAVGAPGRARRAPRATPQLCRRAVRVPDPCLAVHGAWLIRRLAPDCSRIRLASLPRGHDEARLLWMMGWETANMHLGTPRQRRAILGILARRRTALARQGRAAHGRNRAPRLAQVVQDRA